MRDPDKLARGGFVSNTVALMVMDVLYGNGTFRELTDNERVTSNLLMFVMFCPRAFSGFRPEDGRVYKPCAPSPAGGFYAAGSAIGDRRKPTAVEQNN